MGAALKIPSALPAGRTFLVLLLASAGISGLVGPGFSAFATTPDHRDDPVPVALFGATVVDGTGAPPLQDAVVVLAQGRIECVGPRGHCPVPDGIPTLDVTGHWITPGLVDAHAHFSLSGWVDSRPDLLDLRAEYPYASTIARLRRSPELFFQSYLCSGVTAVFDLGGFPWTWELRDRARVSGAAPTIAAAGPFLSTRDAWLNLPAERQFLHMSDRDAVRSGADYLISSGADAVKVLHLGGEGPSGRAGREREYLELAGRWARSGGIPLIVHATELELAREALEAGASILAHSVEDQVVDDAFVDLLRRRGGFYTPTLWVHEAAAQLRERHWVEDELDEICVDPGTLERLRSTSVRPGRDSDDQLADARMDDEGRRRVMEENLLRIHAAGVPLLVGSDAGNPLVPHGPGIHRELGALQAAGIPPEDLLRAATLNGARAMGMAEIMGSVEAGKVADLLVLRGDPLEDVANLNRSLRMVVRGGYVLGRDDLAFTAP
ncbi:MAG: hypothetical protein EA422_04445 [Gemmatimonadales bacterium]|nr:MAG: hypothetical protein EA422_04445 [Gemmatimonadales bacterium]